MTDDYPYEQVIDDCLAEKLGDGGLSRAAFEKALAAADGALDTLRRQHVDDALPLLQLPGTHDDLPTIEARAAHHRDQADDVVILGTGGSSLGGRALYALADSGFGPSGAAPKLHFLDNIDPHTFDHMFRSLDPARTDLIVISKSGGTPETLSQFLTCLAPLFDAVGRQGARDRVTVITEPTDNPLRHLASTWGFTIMDHDPGIGGRYSVLSLVGLLPAAIAGLDIARIRDGAHQVLHASLTAARADASDPAVGAALNVALAQERGITATVIMPYDDRLAWLAMWHRQLWAESLGKDGQGTLPVRALGTVDQHSQLQLYLDGPRDKMFTLIMADVAGSGRIIEPVLADDKRLAYLAGRTMGDLLDAEQRATATALARNGRPTRVLHIDRVDEGTVGGLMMHFILETIIAAHLLGVDPFDQPAVEEGKVLARENLAKMAPGWTPRVVG
jgi:glucose-6-phosphate isomerase